MDYLILYYDLIDRKYNYRLFGCIENLYAFQQNLFKNHITRFTYVYKIFGRRGDIHR